MMVDKVEIIEKEDPSVKELLGKTADQLRHKYTNNRNVKEKYLKTKKPLNRFLTIILDVVCILVLILGFVICFSTINTTIHGYMPNFAGYSNLVISSKSMVKSGYNVGDVLIVHSVNPKSLNVDDKIAFYVYGRSYKDFDVSQTRNVSDVKSKTKYSFNFPQLFGFQSKEIEQAAKTNSKIVFHHIREVYEDKNGERWFKTYGSSNSSDDSWWINEKYIVGIEDTGFFSKTMLSLIDFSAKPYGISLVLIPAGILVLILIFSFIKNIQVVKLELDCVEEKRKITDPICVKNKVGLQMDMKTKYKILAQSTDENRNEYIKLLFKDGEAPNSIKKYYLRKKFLLRYNRDLLILNRECEEMFKNGVNPEKIAKYYLTNKKSIEAKNEETKKRIKSIDNHKIETISQENKNNTTKRSSKKSDLIKNNSIPSKIEKTKNIKQQKSISKNGKSTISKTKNLTKTNGHPVKKTNKTNKKS